MKNAERKLRRWFDVLFTYLCSTEAQVYESVARILNVAVASVMAKRRLRLQIVVGTRLITEMFERKGNAVQ